MIGYPRHQRVDIAAQNLGRIANRLAPLHLQVVHTEKDCLTTKLGHARFERDAGPRAWVLEEQPKGLTGKIRVRLALLMHPLQSSGRFQKLVDLVRCEISVD